jgi:hypothetical protein
MRCEGVTTALRDRNAGQTEPIRADWGRWLSVDRGERHRREIAANGHRRAPVGGAVARCNVHPQRPVVALGGGEPPDALRPGRLPPAGHGHVPAPRGREGAATACSRTRTLQHVTSQEAVPRGAWRTPERCGPPRAVFTPVPARRSHSRPFPCPGGLEEDGASRLPAQQ